MEMSEILVQQEEADASILKEQKSLNQTMREALAKTKVAGLAFQTGHFKGAYVISRKIIQIESIDENTPTEIKEMNKLTEEEVDFISIENPDSEKLFNLIQQLGLIDNSTDLTTDLTTATPNPPSKKSMHYSLKEQIHKDRCLHAKFMVEDLKTVELISESLTKYTLLYGRDLGNHSFLFRVTPANQGDITPMIRECMVVFNRSHRLEISSVILPGANQATQTSVNKQDDLFKIIKKNTPFQTIYDPTLYFLRYKFPASRYIASVGADDGFPNETDVVSMTSHMSACTWEMAQLHWVFEGLCSVVVSLVIGKYAMNESEKLMDGGSLLTDTPQPSGIPKLMPLIDENGDIILETPEETDVEDRNDGFVSKFSDSLSHGMKLRAYPMDFLTKEEFVRFLIGPENTYPWEENLNLVHSWVHCDITSEKKTGVKLGSSDHDTMLKQIAKMAKLATEAYKLRNPREYQNAPALAKLNSPYNDSTLLSKLDHPEILTAEYFGYKMTQWLLSEIEKCTVLVPKKDQNTPHAQLRAGIRDVNCQLYTAGIKSTYTTDVLLDITRKSFISPWEVMYGEDEASWPGWLKAYSLKKHFCNVHWTGSDKRISVVVGITHRVRYTFHAFKRRVEGVKVIAKAPKKVESISVPNGSSIKVNDGTAYNKGLPGINWSVRKPASSGFKKGYPTMKQRRSVAYEKRKITDGPAKFIWEKA